MQSSAHTLHAVTTSVLPENPDPTSIYRLVPNDPDSEYYRERTDRNIGWISQAEQEYLRTCVVGIAGTGGMGGLLAGMLVRLGIGEVRIADCEEFDASNINRQFAATRRTIGVSKAFATARLVRDISDDTTLVVYPQGITERTVDHFLDGVNVVLDEIELLAIDARILLHRQAREAGVSLFNCNTVGWSTNLFLYTPESVTMEAMTGLSYEEARLLRERASGGDQEAFDRIARVMVRAVIPQVPEYARDDADSTSSAFSRRLLEERRAAIIATNPPGAGSFLATRMLLFLLRESATRRSIAETPVMPGYLSIDFAHMTAETVTTGAWRS